MHRKTKLWTVAVAFAALMGLLAPRGDRLSRAQFETNTPRPPADGATLTPTIPAATATPSPTLTPTATPSPTGVPFYQAPYQAEVYRTTALWGGPNITYYETGVVYEGASVFIVERNSIGNWVRVHQLDSRGRVTMDGWMPGGFLTYDPALNYANVPVNTTLMDGEIENVDSRTEAEVYAYPIISPISDKMREVFALGQSLGNQPNVITKVGDSVSANQLYLTLLNRPDNRMGPYLYLAPTVKLFGDAAALPSVASRVGMTTYTIFDPMWANKEICEPNETPLTCEYRTKKPFAALILFGANDVRHMTDAQFKEQMRKIVEESLAVGVIPILSTFSADPNGELWFQSLNFNLRLGEIAAEYEVPLINLWSASRVLPDFGLEIDRVHMKNWGFDYLRFDNGSEAYSGAALQNLLAIKMLDELRIKLEITG